MASCSLRKSRSPISLGSCGLPSHCQSRIKKGIGLANFEATVKAFEDVETGSDGDSSCYFMPDEDSSVGVDTEDENDSVSQTSKTCEGHIDIQEGILEDIKTLFGEDQGLAGDTVQVSNCNS